MDEIMRPARVVAPGRIIRRELEARGWTQKNLAKIVGRPEQTISNIISGRKRITPETALQLAEAFGTSPELWINLETQYQLHLARDKYEETSITRKSQLYSAAPISELVKRGWIKASDSIEELEREVCSFLEIESLDQQPQLAVSFRHTQTREPEARAQIAWAKRVEHLARAQHVEDFSPDRIEAALLDLLACSTKPEDVARVPSLLQGLGIRFVIVPHLPKTYLDGAAFAGGEHPIIALTLRYNRIDNFWFTLMHELGHITAGHSGVFLDNLEDLEDNKDEAEANQLAQDWLIDPRELARFVAETKPYFSRKKIAAFAHQQGRHPGIVLGRLHHDGEVPPQNLRAALLVKTKPYLEDWIDVSGPN
jgi:HTH-type transcriptional regulator/antitoxin HigA